MKIGEHKIESAEAFVRLRLSEVPQESTRAAYAWAEDAVWHDVLDRFPEMARWVIHNKPVPHTILDRLIERGDADIRGRVCSKRKLTPNQMARLAQDVDPTVRQSIAEHPKIAEELLERLQKDSNHWVRRSAYQALVARKAERARRATEP